jgi:phosphoribosylanthranilate isomerase
MVRVKLCGMTNLDDCRAAADLGVDFAGFVFYRKSRRQVEPRKVRKIVEGLNGEMKTVGVFVEETEEEMKEIISLCGLDYAQVYRPVALPNRISVTRVKDRVPDTAEGMVLFDSYTEA